jgi:type I restriction enzyme S subunit
MREGWRETRLGEVAAINPEVIDVRADREVKYVDLSAVSAAGGIDTKAVTRVQLSAAPGRARRLIRADDVLVATVRPYLRGFAVVPHDLDQEVASTGFAVLRAIPGVALPGFVWLLVTTESFVDGLMRLSTGSNYPAVRPADVAVQPVVLPPVAEQRRIVDLVEAIDRLRLDAEGLRRMALDSRDAIIEAELARHRDLPAVALSELADVTGGLTKDQKREAQDGQIQVPYLRVANVQRGRLDLSDLTEIRVEPEKAERLRLVPGDVLFNEGGDRDKLGRGWVWEGQVAFCIHQNHVLRARIRDSDFDPYFVSIWGNSAFGRRWFEVNGAQTTNLASVSLSTLKRFPVPRVAHAEQRRIAELSDALGRAASIAGEVALRAGTLRGAVLRNLLSGAHQIPAPYDRFLDGTA